MKLDTIALWVIAAGAGLAALAYFIAILVGVVASGGLLLPVLAIFVAVVALFVAVLRQRLANREDDHYDRIER